jgi:hypothetical protein
VNDKPKTGIQIFQKPTSKEISVVDGGIKISASEILPAALQRMQENLCPAGLLPKHETPKLTRLSQESSIFPGCPKKGYLVGLISFRTRLNILRTRCRY